MKQQKLVSKGIDTVMYNNNQISVFQAENKFWSVERVRSFMGSCQKYDCGN